MSDFIDFFPVSGGSGVGSGIPINGYFPFIVSSTGDPTGYDSTTGLYTHPDGTFWLKSGFQIADSTNAYPSSATTGTTYRTALYTGAYGRGASGGSVWAYSRYFYNSTAGKYYSLSSTNGNAQRNASPGSSYNSAITGNEDNYEISTTGVSTSISVTNNNISIGVGNSQIYGLSWDDLNNRFVAVLRTGNPSTVGAQTITSYLATCSTEADLNSTSNWTRLGDWQATVVTDGNTGLAVVDINPANGLINVWLNRTPTSGGYIQYSLDAAATLTSEVQTIRSTYGNSASDAFRIASVSATDIRRYESAVLTSYPTYNDAIDRTNGTVLTDAGFNIAPTVSVSSINNPVIGPNPSTNFIISGLSNGQGQSQWGVYTLGTGISLVGDSTARTDTDSAQPLFVRIG